MQEKIAVGYVLAVLYDAVAENSVSATPDADYLIRLCDLFCDQHTCTPLTVFAKLPQSLRPCAVQLYNEAIEIYRLRIAPLPTPTLNQSNQTNHCRLPKFTFPLFCKSEPLIDDVFFNKDDDAPPDETITPTPQPVYQPDFLNDSDENDTDEDDEDDNEVLREIFLEICATISTRFPPEQLLEILYNRIKVLPLNKSTSRDSLLFRFAKVARQHPTLIKIAKKRGHRNVPKND